MLRIYKPQQLDVSCTYYWYNRHNTDIIYRIIYIVFVEQYNNTVLLDLPICPLGMKTGFCRMVIYVRTYV